MIIGGENDTDNLNKSILIIEKCVSQEHTTCKVFINGSNHFIICQNYIYSDIIDIPLRISIGILNEFENIDLKGIIQVDISKRPKDYSIFKEDYISEYLTFYRPKTILQSENFQILHQSFLLVSEKIECGENICSILERNKLSETHFTGFKSIDWKRAI